MTARFGRRAAVQVVAIALAATTLGGCDLSRHGLSASSSCHDFLNASRDDEVASAEDLYHGAHPQEPKIGMGSTNAVYNVSFECLADPSRHLGDLGDFN